MLSSFEDKVGAEVMDLWVGGLAELPQGQAKVFSFLIWRLCSKLAVSQLPDLIKGYKNIP